MGTNAVVLFDDDHNDDDYDDDEYGWLHEAIILEQPVVIGCRVGIKNRRRLYIY